MALDIDPRLAVPAPFPMDGGSPPIKPNHRAARAAIAEWLADDSDYDEKTWPEIQAAIEDNRLSERNRFGD